MDCRHAYPVLTAWTIPTASGAYETFMLCTNGPDDVLSCKNRNLRKARYSPLLGRENQVLGGPSLGKDRGFLISSHRTSLEM